MSLYALSNIKQIFEGQTVLDLPSLELEAGQSYALLGPNGSGKTTLLHILALLKAPAGCSWIRKRYASTPSNRPQRCPLIICSPEKCCR